MFITYTFDNNNNKKNMPKGKKRFQDSGLLDKNKKKTRKRHILVLIE